MANKKKTPTAVNKDLGVVLNNTVQAAWLSPAIAGLSDLRRKQLRHYMSAILDEILEHRKEGYITSEELVAVFAGAALFLHQWFVQGTSRLPMYEHLGAEIVEDMEQNG